MKYAAIFTETSNSGNSGRDAVTADLLVVFAMRDALAQDDVEGTRPTSKPKATVSDVRDFDFLR